MPHFNYAISEYEIRPDIPETYEWYWQRLAAPGSWWTGAERVAIAAEVRRAPDCEFCAERKEALSPYSLKGEHDSEPGSPLSPAAIDAVHRIVTDQTRITKSWIDSLADEGISAEAYVELAGIVVAVFSIDEFNRMLGLAPAPLPASQPGEPTGYRPALEDREIGFVPMLPRDGNVGAEADLWGERGANVVRALSIVPDAVRDWFRIAGAQYLTPAGMANMVKDDNRVIDRMQMELIAGRVSAINQCFY